MIPINNSILIKCALEDTKETKRGLQLSTDIKLRNKYTKSAGTIIALGKGVNQEYSELEVNDEIRFREHAGYAVKEDDDFLYRVVQDVDIYVITKKGK
jgi:co-chaperonin GroES (HSP10)